MDESNFELASQLDERNRAEAIDAARAMVEREGTPDCEACGEPVGTERRLAAPWATRCIDCQQAHELARAHYFHRFF